MGHAIDLFIAPKPIKETKVLDLGFALIHEEGYVLIPLHELNVDSFEIENNIEDDDYGENIALDTKVMQELARVLGAKSYVIASLDTPDFIGSTYVGAQKIKHEVPINQALHALGVPAKNGSEFDYLNLGAYRQTELYYLEAYVNHKDRSNIQRGHIRSIDYGKGI
ncbi:MAG: hypothetical protein NXI09_10000 [Bacteroidetes bacterium]|nr:hypothetical protein [Bacteroidota bacterium]